MSAESAHLSTFGAETETEAEIRSTSSYRAFKTKSVKESVVALTSPPLTHCELITVESKLKLLATRLDPVGPCHASKFRLFVMRLQHCNTFTLYCVSRRCFRPDV